MSLNIGDNFKYLGKKFLDDRQSFPTLEAMKNCVSVPDGFITYCKEDEKRYEFNSSNNINELTGKWTEFVITQELPEIEDCYYLGIDTPEEDKIWFFSSQEQAESTVSYENPLITELFSCIRTLQDQVAKLQADVEYLKINGGGGIPIEPPDDPGEEEVTVLFLTLENGGFFELEDGGFLILEEDVVIVKESTLVLEDGTQFLLEDGGFILLEENIDSVKKNLMLLESGAELLLENGYNILIES